MNENLRLLACQIDIPPMTTGSARDAHLARVAAKIDTALTKTPTDLVVLPELASLDYARETFARLPELAEPLDGPSFQIYKSIAQKHKCTVLFNFARAEAGNFYITAAAVGPDGALLGYYDKLHLCQYGASMEKEYFTAGNHLFTFNVHGFTLAPIICYDIRIPELCRTLTLDHKVDAILHGGAYYRDKSFATWHAFAQTRALENQIYFLSLNRAGTHYGNSLFCPPWMDENTPPTPFPNHKEALLHLTLKKSEISRIRAAYTFLTDRRNTYKALG